MKSTLRALVMAILAGALGLTLALVPTNFTPEQTAAIAAEYLPGVPHPQFPDIEVYYDKNGDYWLTRTTAVNQNNMLKARAAQAASQAQAVPGGYYNRLVNAAKAGTATALKTPAKVMTAAKASRYSPAAILHKTQRLGEQSVKAVNAAKASATRILASPIGPLVKVSGAVGASMVSYEVGVMVGGDYVEAMGIDAAGLVCTQGAASGFLALASGQDCGAWAAHQEFIANEDAAAGVASADSCATVSGVTDCARVVKLVSVRISNKDYKVYCLAGTRGGQPFSPSSMISEVRTSLSSGAWVSVGSSGFSGIGGDHCGVDPAQRYGLGTVAVMTLEGIRVGTGNLAFVGATSGDPERLLECSVTGTNGTIYRGNSLPYRETDEVFSPPACPTLPAGVYPTHVEFGVSGGNQGTKQLYAEDSTPEFQAQLAAYPECMDGSCLLDLRTAGASCFEGLTDCADWVSSPTRDTDYQCRYGTHDVAISQCFIYGELFKPGAAGGSAPLADPTTGMPAGGGAQTTPSDSHVMDNGVAPASEPRNCYPSGWAVFNPVEWVLRPVQCAWEWAMVADPVVVQATATRVIDGWNNTPPGVLITAVGGWSFDVEVTGCQGLKVPEFLPANVLPEFYLAPACPGSLLAPIAPWSRLVLNIALTVGAAGAISWNVASIVNGRGVAA